MIQWTIWLNEIHPIRLWTLKNIFSFPCNFLLFCRNINSFSRGKPCHPTSSLFLGKFFWAIISKMDLASIIRTLKTLKLCLSQRFHFTSNHHLETHNRHNDYPSKLISTCIIAFTQKSKTKKFYSYSINLHLVKKKTCIVRSRRTSIIESQETLLSKKKKFLGSVWI